MNKKGQVLVVFVLILPLILMFLGVIIDVGNSLVIRKKNENVLKDIIVYSFSRDDEMIPDDESENQKPISLDLIEKSIKDNLNQYETLKLNLNGEILEVSVTTTYKSIFASLFNIGLNKIDIIVKYDVKNKKIVRG